MADREYGILDVVTSEYTGVYIVNLKTGEATPYSMKDDIESEIGDVFNSNVKYVDAYKMSVETLVKNEDKSRMMMTGTIGNIMCELRNKKTFETVYRDVNDKYCVMKVIKLGDAQGVPEVVALCFSEKDEELRAREEANRKLRRNLDIISILASEYTSVYYIDLNTDELDTYTMSDETESELGIIFRSGIKYSSSFRMYVESLVYAKDRDMMLQAGSIFNILDQLSNKKSFVTRYRNSDGKYCEMKFVKVGNEEFPQAVALGFSDKNDEIEASIRLERQQAVFFTLVEDFACVNYVDILSESFDNTTAYRSSEILKRLIPGWEAELNFRKRLELMSWYVVVKEDRERFLEETEKSHILKCLDSSLAHYVRFSAMIDGKRKEYEYKFTADKDERGKVRGIVAGLHVVERE